MREECASGSTDPPSGAARHFALAGPFAEDMEFRGLMADVLIAGTALLDASFGVLMLSEPGRRDFRPVVSVGGDPSYLDLLERIPARAVATASAVHQHRSVSVEDTETDPVYSAHTDIAREAGFRAVHSELLVSSRGQALGTLNFYFAAPHRPTGGQLASLALHARLAGRAIEGVLLGNELAEEVTERRHLEAAREQLLVRLDTRRAQLQAIIDQLPVGILMADSLTGSILMANPQTEEILRHPIPPSVQVSAILSWEGYHADGKRLDERDWPLSRALRGEHVHDEEILCARGDQTTGWVRTRAAPIRNEGGAVVGGFVIMMDVDAEKRAQDDQHFLTDAATALGSACSDEQVMARLAQLVVPHLADVVVVELIDEDGVVQHSKSVSASPGYVDLGAHSPGTPSATAAHTGQPVFLPEIGGQPAQVEGAKPGRRRSPRPIVPTSLLALPLVAHGAVLGVLTLATTGTRRRLSETDLNLATWLAAHAALVLESVRLTHALRQSADCDG